MFSPIIHFLIISFIGTTGFYVYDSIAVFGPYLLKLNFTEIEISWLYSAYYYPNIIISLFAGTLIDKWGLQKSLLCFSTLSFIACILMSTSLSFEILLIGRIILGMSAISIFICQIKLFNIHYSTTGQNLTLVFSFSLVYNRLSSFLAYITLPLIINATNIRWGFLTCMFLSFLCWITNITYFKYQKDIFEPQTINIKHGIRFCIKQCNMWLLLGIALFYYGAFMSFNALSPIILQQKLSVTPEFANQIASILTLGSIIFSPIIGFLTDKYGRLAIFNGLAILISIISFSLFLFPTSITIMIGIMLGLGFSYGVVPSLLYRSINLVIPTELTGIATGMIEATIAFAVILFPTLFSVLYQDVAIIYAFLLIDGLLVCTYILNMIFGFTQ